MKIIANVLMASALMAGVSSFAADRMNATEGTKSQADKPMQTHTSDMPMKNNATATTGSMATDTVRKNATTGDKSEADKNMQKHASDMPMKGNTTTSGMAGDTARKNATVGDKSEAKK